MKLTGRWPQPLVTLATLVIIGFAARTAGAQQRTLTGHVEADVSGEPIAGAVITVVGTNTGTETAADGMFSLTVPAGADQLSIRAIGYRSSEITLSAGQTTIIIALERDAFRLDEIVVTGRATGVARRNQASSVARLVADDLVKVSNASLEQSLQGKIPGAMIRSNSPAPGGGASINLRGVTSIIGNNSPLYVVDGLIISDAATQPGVNTITGAFPDGRFTTTQGNAVNRIADLNPDDIESVEVLKGASAAAIYGSKAAGGVIIITTKRGQQGAPRFHVRQQFGTSQASRKVGFRTFESLAEAQSVYSNAADYWTGEVYDHEDLLIGGRPLSYETSANLSGGSSDLRYFASGLVRHEGGVIRNTFGDKQAVRMNLEKFVNDRLTVNLGTQFIRTESDRGIHQNENTGNTMYGALTGTPTFIDLRQRPDGTFPINPYSGSNPFETVEKVKNNETVWRFVGTGSADLEILQGDVHDLTLSAVGVVDWFQQKNNVYAPPDAQFEPNDGLPGTVVISQTQNLNLNLNFFAVHGYEGSGFNLTSSVGTQYESVDYDVNRNRGQNLVGGLRNVSAGTVQTSLQQLLRTEDFGFFLQEEALIGDRLFLTAGIRGDQSSNNSDDQAIYWYPKAAASYTFPLETEVVRDLKVRMAYGQTGNQPRYGQKFTVLVPGNVTGVGTYQIQGSTAASDLRPERQAEIEGGFDATLLDGRIRLEATVYEKTISDLLLSRTLLPSSGFGSLVSNGGKMRTRGVEASLVGNFFQGGAIEWQPMVNFSAWRCTILELPGGEFRPGGFGTSFGERRLAEGESCTQIIASDTLEAGPVKIGDDRPDFTMGISNSVQYIGREGYALDAVNQEFVNPLLTGTLDPSRFYVTFMYNGRFSTIRLANEVLNGVEATDAFSEQEKEVLRGFAKLVQGHEFLTAISVFDESGLPIDVNRPPDSEDLAPVESKAAVYSHIESLLGQAINHFNAGGGSVPFTLIPGWAGFNSPGGLASIASALLARAQVYSDNWSGALSSLAGSFVDPTGDLSSGVYHSFSTASGDTPNLLFDPNRERSHGHETAVADAQSRANGQPDLRLTGKQVISDLRTILGIDVMYQFTVYSGPTDHGPIIKNEELVLLRAEANLGMGNAGAALADINAVRTASGGLEPIDMAAWMGMSDSERLDELLYNKRYSLMWEGTHRWADMRHYGRLGELPRALPAHIVWPYFPLPSNECIKRSPEPPGCAVPAPVP